MLTTPSPDFITLAEVMEDMAKGHRFNITFVKCDVKRGTGGEMVTWHGCVQSMGKVRGKDRKEAEPSPEQKRKNPHHYQNATRNTYRLKEGEVRKVHIRLITHYNGKRVL